MNKELQALAHNNTWDMFDLSTGKKPIGSKWVFKIKLRSDEQIERYKGKLVAKKNNQ